MHRNLLTLGSTLLIEELPFADVPSAQQLRLAP